MADLNDYLGVLRRQWWILLLSMTVGIFAGFQYDRGLPREYAATASVLVYPVGQDTNVAGGRTRDDINLDTEAQLVRSTSVLTAAAEQLAEGADLAALAEGVSVEVPANTSVLKIKYSATSPAAAQAGAHAFAVGYLRNREALAHSTLATQTEALQRKLSELTAELDDINTALIEARAASAAYAMLDSQRGTTISQISELSTRINQLSTQTVSGGVIIRDAQLPAYAVKPHTPLNLAAGALLALMLGVALAALRERLDRRVRSAADLRRHDIAMLGEIVDPAIRGDDVYPPFSPGGRAFNRLRNEVAAALTSPAPGSTARDTADQVVVVTGASRGCAATVVAANLAAALARTGADVVLVGAHAAESISDTASLAGMLGVAPTPGLSDVLAGRNNLAEATQRAARNPSLRVITPGGTGSAGGLLQSQALGDIVGTLRSNTRYLVIEAPSTTTSADAQSLASLADAAILAVELRRSALPEVTDAVEQFRRVGTRLLGAVLLPRLPAALPAAQPDGADTEQRAPDGSATLAAPVPATPQEETALMSPITAGQPDEQAHAGTSPAT